MKEHQLFWDIGSAYDFFLSLRVIHDPDAWGLRGAWAAGVRSRLAPPHRDFFKSTDKMMFLPSAWIHALPAPKDGRTALQQLAKVAPNERLTTLFPFEEDSTLGDFIQNVQGDGDYGGEDVSFVFKYLRDQARLKGIKRQAAEQYLHWRMNSTEFGERMLAGLTEYYEEFFAEEEQRILPYLERTLEQAKQTAARLPLNALVEELTSGVHLEQLFFERYQAFTLVPSFWVTPILIIGQLHRDHVLFLFGARSADASLVPGEVVPEALYRALKALADPTRLRIMRYLAQEPQSPTELATKLRLRTPTVSHHLHTLRLAQLVVVYPAADGSRHYSARTEALDGTLATLKSFLSAR